MPCRHGPRPTAWWRPTAPCSISMCGRCCGASMPRSTQASSGLRRNRCLTFPSWRRPKTSSTNTKTRQPKQGLRQGRPSPSSPQQPAPAAAKGAAVRAGPARAARALRNLRSLHKCGLSLSLKRSRHRGSRSPRRTQWPPQQRGAPPPPSRTPPQPPPLPRPSQAAPPREAKALAGPQPPQAKPALAPRGRSPARGQAGEEALAVEGDHQMGRGDAGHSGDRRRTVDVARQARSARLRQRSGRARRQIDEQGRANPTPTIRGAERPIAFPAPHSCHPTC